MTALAMVVAFVVAALLTRWFARPGSPLYVLDHPNERSLHETPTPRTGGLAILAGIAAAQVVALAAHAALDTMIAAGALVVAAVAFIDDLRHLPAAARFLVQLGVAALLVATGLLPARPEILPGVALALPPVVIGVLAVLFIVWMSNLYNFMDGMDGFAGGMTVFGFGGLALACAAAAPLAYTLLAWSVAAAAAGFLLFNFPPARIFMGDAGSSTLGLLAAALALRADAEGWVPLWASVLLFSPFIVDATATLIRRAARGERVWQAHRTHYYQRLVRLGWGHRRTVLAEYVLMAACVVTTLAVLFAASTAAERVVVASWVVVYAVIAAAVHRLEKGPPRRPESNRISVHS